MLASSCGSSSATDSSSASGSASGSLSSMPSGSGSSITGSGSGVPPSKTMRSRAMISSAEAPRVARVRFAHMVKASSSSSRSVTWASSSLIISAVLPADSLRNLARISSSLSEVRSGGAIAAVGAGITGTIGATGAPDSSVSPMTGREPVKVAPSAGGAKVFRRGPSVSSGS